MPRFVTIRESIPSDYDVIETLRGPMYKMMIAPFKRGVNPIVLSYDQGEEENLIDADFKSYFHPKDGSGNVLMAYSLFQSLNIENLPKSTILKFYVRNNVRYQNKNMQHPLEVPLSRIKPLPQDSLYPDDYLEFPFDVLTDRFSHQYAPSATEPSAIVLIAKKDDCEEFYVATAAVTP